MSFSAMMGNIFDSIFAPPGALDADALDHISPAHDFTMHDIPSACEPTALSNTHFASDMDLSWHNGFGTMNDYEDPASGHTTFDSNFDSGCGSDWP
jgi:hypothetical protein